MQNLIKAFQKQQLTERKAFVSTLNTDYSCIIGLVSNWRMKSLLPKDKQKASKWDDLKILKVYVLKRFDAKQGKDLQKFVNQVNGDILNGVEKIENINISVTWAKSKTWGKNPSAEVHFTYKDKDGDIQGNTVYSGSITGCGYDKESTAVARALNQIDPLIKHMYKMKNKKVKSANRDIFGYGSGYGLLPSFEGGVGVSCYPAIFAKLGFIWSSVAHGSNFDVYSIKSK